MRLSIGQKLGLGFGGVLLLIVISSGVIFLALDRINTSAEAVTGEAVPALRACDDLLIVLNRTMAATRGYLLLGERESQASYFEKEFSDSLQRLETVLKQFDELIGKSENPADQIKYQSVMKNAHSFLKAQQVVREIARSIGTGTDRDLTEAIRQMETEAVPKSREIRAAVVQLKEAAANRMLAARDALEMHRVSARSTLLFTTLMAIALGIGIAWALTRTIATSIRSLLSGVQMVADGHLNQPVLVVNSRDEIGDLTRGFNKMVASLRTIISETRSTTAEVASSSGEIATGAQQQLASLNQTATSLNEITTTAEEFKATMQEFADRAKAVHEAADETAKQANEGLSLSRDSATRIEKVRDNSRQAGESVLHLAEQMQRIGEITASVNEIAEQTKLLALNASIEAARAGEEGRGFAVVAMQVRELANQSKDAAGRIEALITQTQKSMQSVVGKIEEGGRLSEDSTEKVRHVSASFDEISRAIEQTRQAMSQINTGARQQEVGITELVNSIVEIDSASKESVAAAEQTQKSIIAIDERLRILNSIIGRFKT